MITTRSLYIGTGVAMLLLMMSMVLDQFIPRVDSFWIDVFAHPVVAYIGVLVLIVFAFDRSEVNGTELLFTLTLITLFTVLMNEGLVSLVGIGSLPIEISALASLSVHVRAGWAVVAIAGIASVLSGATLFSSVLVTVIIGVGLTVLIGGVRDEA